MPVEREALSVERKKKERWTNALRSTLHALRIPALLASTLSFASLAAADDDAPIHRLIPWLLDEKQSLKGILFSDVIAATSGKMILPFDPKDADDQRIAKQIGSALDTVLLKLNAPDSPAQRVRRINEVSSHFESLMQTLLNAVPDFSCDFPRTATGQKQRSGYPDLRLVDKKTGRVCYLDPKLYAKDSRDSTFRTFYFEPQRETNKVNDDAHHFIVGIEHERTDSGWKFMRWELIDLAQFKVKLKAEFEGSNRDLYRPEAVVSSGGILDSPQPASPQ